MTMVPDDTQLAETLPGIWHVGATNFPMWVDGKRIAPTFSYELRDGDPLALTDVVSWSTAEGTQKKLVGVDRWRDGSFVWRGNGLLWLFKSRWSVIGMSEDGTIAAIRFTKSRVSPAGVDVMVRDGSDTHTLRTTVAGATDTFGLTHEEFASLTWLDFEARS